MVLAFVAVLALDHYHNHLSHTPGIDFYQYWAVPTARRISVEPLGTPYAESERYGQILEDFSRHSTDSRLAAVTEYWQTPDFASDPLLYVMGSWLPASYTTALKIYQFLQFFAFALALVLFARRASLPGPETATLGLLMFVYYMPVLSELRVLNTNALQLAALAAAASLLASRRAGRAGLALALTVLVVFLKPVWVLLPGLVALYLLRTHGRATALRALGVAGAFGLALLAWPAVVFGPAVWSEWYRAVFSGSPDRLLYGIEEGNRSAAMVLAQETGMGIGESVGVLALVLALSLFVAAALRLGASGPGRWRLAASSLSDTLLRSPETTLSLGIVAMLALSPLTWWHYYTLALLPIFALLSSGASRAQAVLACLSFLLSSGRLGPVYVWFTDADWATVCGAAFAWVPLWLGLLLPWASREQGPSSSEVGRTQKSPEELHCRDSTEREFPPGRTS